MRRRVRRCAGAVANKRPSNAVGWRRTPPPPYPAPSDLVSLLLARFPPLFSASGSDPFAPLKPLFLLRVWTLVIMEAVRFFFFGSFTFKTLDIIQITCFFFYVLFFLVSILNRPTNSRSVDNNKYKGWNVKVIQ